MSAGQDLLPNPDTESDEDDFSDDDPWDSGTEEDPPDRWTTNPIIPVDPLGFSVFFTNVQSLKSKVEQIYHETTDVEVVGVCETWLDSRTDSESYFTREPWPSGNTLAW